ncbi:acetolactate synthase, small subunit [Halobacteroides halobius DSM 5150]|uniref:Acetolactate synthase small subunit n=1 Tax=Halobacteroides halobius (strain ATCC 35273 / DSM 5150 / MD-1) TaxID=748449 RepID=L0K5G4_HALHC|nr:acetolactate synthase small subunit [Halobacteroides halobius]AGB40256.1 acetolactate synthase, small subunit [Halobacteroides halobius DSM 5150]
MRHTVSVLVANESGVLARIAGLFSRRGFNIDSLSVSRTEDDTTSRITLVVAGDKRELEQVTKQLNKLVIVYKVSDITNDETVDRGLALIKVQADSNTRSEIIQIVDSFRGKIVDVATNSIMIEITGDESKINAIEKLLNPFGIKELVRTGKIAMGRGKK